jgi:hypothetical protein
MAGRNYRGINGTAGNDNDLFANHDDVDPNQGGLERIAHQAANPQSRSLGSRYKEHFAENFEWVERAKGQLDDFGGSVGAYFRYMGYMLIAPYIIPTAKAVISEEGSGENEAHEKAAIAGILTGVLADIGQLVLYGHLMFKDLGHEGGRFNWEYLLVIPAANLVDGVFVEPLRKSLKEIKEERERHR